MFFLLFLFASLVRLKRAAGFGVEMAAADGSSCYREILERTQHCSNENKLFVTTEGPSKDSYYSYDPFLLFLSCSVYFNVHSTSLVCYSVYTAVSPL